MQTLSIAEVDAYREQRYRGSVNSVEQALAWIERVGFGLLLGAKGFTIPSLHAVSPQTDDLPWFGWKVTLTEGRSIWAGALLRSKVTLLSRHYFPQFHTAYAHPGGAEALYRSGKLSHIAYSLYQAIGHGHISTTALKATTGMSAPGRKSAFRRALIELQRWMIIARVGSLRDPSGWVTDVWGLTVEWLPEWVCEAEGTSVDLARQQILKGHLDNVLVAPPAELSRLFGWSKAETTATLEALVEQDRARWVRVEGQTGDWAARERNGNMNVSCKT